MKKTIFWYIWSSLFVASFLLRLFGVFKLAPAENLFADTRSLCGVHHFGDVLSNMSFILVGIYGIYSLIKNDNNDINMWLIALGSMLVGLGSSYYHLNPNNNTLLWDRLPMSIVFSGIFMYAMAELDLVKKINYIPASIAYLVFSMATVITWYIGTKIHHDLIAPYVFLQFGGMILIIILALMAFFESKNKLAKTLISIIACYALAKVFEHFDFQIFTALNHIISGHSIKHIVSAFAIWLWFNFLQKNLFNWKTNFLQI